MWAKNLVSEKRKRPGVGSNEKCVKETDSLELTAVTGD